MSDAASILVVGSINMDLVVRTPHIPAPGETVLGGDLVTSPGGKGANQAVAVARLGGCCRMIGRVGADGFGKALLANLRAAGVDCTSVRPLQGVASGVAQIAVSDDGENAIVVAPGANSRLTAEDIAAETDAFAAAAVVLVQLELPLPTVRATVRQAKQAGCYVIFDPAPAHAALGEDLFAVDVISPNVSEAMILTGRDAADRLGDAETAEMLVQRGAAAAVLKLGAGGSLVYADGVCTRVEPYPVTPVDTTAAGDAFTGALAVAVAEGRPLVDAARFANAAGALACTRTGAQRAMPTAGQVRELMGGAA